MIVKKFQLHNLTRCWVNLTSTKFSYSVSTANNKDWKLGFLGTGRIAQAIILGLIEQNKVKPEQIFVSDANLEYLSYLKEKCPKFRVKIKSNKFKKNIFI